MKVISKVLIPLLLSANLFANTQIEKELIISHDQMVKSKLEKINSFNTKTSLTEFDEDAFSKLDKKEVSTLFRFFFESSLSNIYKKYKILKNDKAIEDFVLNLTKNSLSLKQTLKIYTHSQKIKNEKSFSYEFLYELNLYLKHILGSMYVDNSKLNTLLTDTYFLANELREIVLNTNEFSKVPSISVLKNLDSYNWNSDYKLQDTMIGASIEGLNQYKVLNKELSGDKIYLEPKIYLIDSNELVIKANNVTMHPLALIYAPSSVVSIVSNGNGLTTNSLSIFTKGLQKRNLSSDNKDYAFELLNLLNNKNNVAEKVNSILIPFLNNEGKKLNSDKYISGYAVSNDAMNGGNVSIKADVILGVNYIDASGANGHKGLDSKGALSQIDGKLYSLVILNNQSIPSHPTNGQHGGHGGDLTYTASKQFKSNKNFTCHCISEFGIGGKAGVLKGSFDLKYKDMNKYKAYHGLSGHAGKVENFIIVE